MTDREAKQMWMGGPRYKLLTEVLPLSFCRVDLAATADRTAYQEHKVVWEESDGWYFVDETWTAKTGPFDTEEAARHALSVYCRDVLGL